MFVFGVHGDVYIYISFTSVAGGTIGLYFTNLLAGRFQLPCTLIHHKVCVGGGDTNTSLPFPPMFVWLREVGMF